MTEVEELRREEDEGPIGIFPSWRWLYVTVVAYTAAITLLLYLFTVTLDHGAP